MLEGIVLIVAGVGLFLTAPAYSDVAGRYARWRADEMRARRTPRPLTRLAELNARFGLASAIWFGRVLGVAAIVAGSLLLIRG